MIKFQDYIVESKTAELAHKLGLTAAGYGLWRDKTGKVVKKTQGDKLVDVRGSEANEKHYNASIPEDKTPNHAEHDMSSDIVALTAKDGASRKSSSTKHHIIETATVSTKNAAKLHDALVGAGYTHMSSSFGQIYKNGGTGIMISSRPEVSEKPGAKDKDHHKIIIQTEHGDKKAK